MGGKVARECAQFRHKFEATSANAEFIDRKVFHRCDSANRFTLAPDCVFLVLRIKFFFFRIYLHRRVSNMSKSN